MDTASFHLLLLVFLSKQSVLISPPPAQQRASLRAIVSVVIIEDYPAPAAFPDHSLSHTALPVPETITSLGPVVLHHSD